MLLVLVCWFVDWLFGLHVWFLLSFRFVVCLLECFVFYLMICWLISGVVFALAVLFAMYYCVIGTGYSEIVLALLSV